MIAANSLPVAASAPLAALSPAPSIDVLDALADFISASQDLSREMESMRRQSDREAFAIGSALEGGPR